MIRVNAIAKRFGDIQAVEDVSFIAEDGKVTGLLGPNGAGKSTTLRILYGLVAPDHGDVTIDDFDVRLSTERARTRIGVLPDTLGLYSRLTSREHVHYFGRLHGMPEELLVRRTAELMARLDMSDIADRRIDGFSHGQRLKVCLARSLVHDPANVILDEPTNGLDVMTTRTVRKLILELKDRGKSVLFSSHMMHEVARLCDHIVIVSNGRVAAAGTADDIRRVTGCTDLEDAFVELLERERSP